jgi:V/A-type H+-transporting ATPase subunit C
VKDTSIKTYVGTRAYALRGTLLDPGAVQKLAECTSLDELVNRLRGTPYSEYLSDLSAPFEARKLELALRERLAEVHHSIMSSAGRYSILELYYMRHIAWDLKIAMKAKALNRTYEEIVEYLDMRAEELVGRRDLIVRVLSAKDVNEAVSLLSGSEFFEDVQRALASFSAKGEVRFFDVYIDHAVLTAISKEYANNFRIYSSPRATDVGGVGEIVAADIDAYNALSVLRSKLWGLPEQEVKDLIITPTYRVPMTVLTRMVAAESTVEAVKLLEPIFQFQSQTAAGDEQLIDSVEDKLSSEMKQLAAKAFVWQGLSPGVALALLKLLEFEVGNLAAIAIGVEAKMDPKNIIAKLRR